MKSNTVILRIGIGMIIVTALLSTVFSFYTKLKSPVFLRYCMEVPIPEQKDIPNSQILFELNYFTNAVDKRSVVGISFPEVSEMNFSATENAYHMGITFYNTTDPKLGAQYGRYSYRTIYVYLNNFDLADWYGEKVVHQAVIQLNDGTTKNVDLGTIILYRDQLNRQEYITIQGGSSSSDGSSDYNYQVGSKLILLSVKSEALDLSEDLWSVKLGNDEYKDFPPQDYKNNGILTVTGQFNNLQNAQTSYDVYDIRPKLYYKDPEGKKEFYRLVSFNQRKWIGNYWEIVLYLANRGIF